MAKTEGSGRGGALNDLGAWAHLHLWQIQPIRDVLLIVSLIAIVWAGYTASVVTVPVLMALLLAYLFEPIVVRVSKGDPLRRKFAAGGIILAVLVVVVVPVALGLVWAASNAISTAAVLQKNIVQLDHLVRQEEVPTQEALNAAFPNRMWQDAVISLRNDPLSELAHDAESDAGAQRAAPSQPLSASLAGVKELLRFGLVQVKGWVAANPDTLAKRAASTGGDAVTVLLSGVTTIGKVSFGAFLTAFFFFFICTGYQGVLNFLHDLIPTKRRSRVLHLASRMDGVIAGFVRGRLTICAVLSVLFTIGYAIIGAPMPMVLGIATGMLSIVPYLALVTVPVAILLMFIDPSGGIRGTWWWILASPFVLYVIVQGVDDYVLTPAIQGKQTDMDTPSILFATLAGAALLGVYGLLIAIPLAACAKILWIEVALPRIKEWKEGRAADPLPLGGDAPKG